MVQFGYTILYVDDVGKSMSFYQKAFDFEVKMITPDQDYGELQSGSTTLAFAQKKLANSILSNGFQESDLKKPPFAIELGMVTRELDYYWEKAINEGAVLVEPRQTKPWGQEVGYLRDPDGFLIELCTPIKS